jgi:hypothetical protein
MWKLIFAMCLAVSVFGGENAALNRAVMYSIVPDWYRDRPEKSFLTDGIKADRRGQECVGWKWSGRESSGHGVFVAVDLGQVMPLDKAVIHLLAGSNYVYRMTIPREVTVAVSRDGENFYFAGRQAKTRAYGGALPERAEAINPADDHAGRPGARIRPIQ